MNLKFPATDGLIRQDLCEGDGQTISEKPLTCLTLHVQSSNEIISYNSDKTCTALHLIIFNCLYSMIKYEETKDRVLDIICKKLCWSSYGKFCCDCLNCLNIWTLTSISLWHFISEKKMH